MIQKKKLIIAALSGLMATGTLTACEHFGGEPEQEKNNCSANGCSGKGSCGGKSDCGGKSGCGGSHGCGAK